MDNRSSMTTREFLRKEHNNLDLMRLICASMVIVGHSYVLTPAHGQQDVIQHLTGFTYSGSLAVKLFFFISGLLVTNSLLSKQSIPGFLIARSFRIVPGLLFVLLAAALVIGPVTSTLPFPDYFGDPQTYRYVLRNLVYRPDYSLPSVFLANHYPAAVNGSLWSLPFEVACYLVLLGVFVVVRTRTVLLNVTIALVLLDTLLGSHLIMGALAKNEAVGLLPAIFALGALYAVNQDRLRVSFTIPAVLVVLTVVLWRTRFSQLSFALTCCLLLLALSAWKPLLCFRPRYDISYGIYLWGFLIQQTLFHFAGPLNVYVFMLASLLIAFVLGTVSYLAVERHGIRAGRLLDARRAPARSGRVALPEKHAGSRE
ncbi:MAG: acyltransferase [Thermoanaerobaculia bacterium]